MASPEETLRCFVVESRHLTTHLNVFASDMIRKRELVERLEHDPAGLARAYAFSEEEIGALKERNLLKLYHLGLHPFLLVRFAGMVGILEYWQELGAPGRGERKT